MAPQTGIYYLTANVIFKDITGAITLLIGVEGNRGKPNALYAEKRDPTSSTESLSVAGPLLVQKGMCGFVDLL